MTLFIYFADEYGLLTSTNKYKTWKIQFISLDTYLIFMFAIQIGFYVNGAIMETLNQTVVLIKSVITLMHLQSLKGMNFSWVTCNKYKSISIINRGSVETAELLFYCCAWKLNQFTYVAKLFYVTKGYCQWTSDNFMFCEWKFNITLKGDGGVSMGTDKLFYYYAWKHLHS